MVDSVISMNNNALNNDYYSHHLSHHNDSHSINSEDDFKSALSSLKSEAETNARQATKRDKALGPSKAKILYTKMITKPVSVPANNQDYPASNSKIYGSKVRDRIKGYLNNRSLKPNTPSDHVNDDKEQRHFIRRAGKVLTNKFGKTAASNQVNAEPHGANYHPRHDFEYQPYNNNARNRIQIRSHEGIANNPITQECKSKTEYSNNFTKFLQKEGITELDQAKAANQYFDRNVKPKIELDFNDPSDLGVIMIEECKDLYSKLPKRYRELLQPPDDISRKNLEGYLLVGQYAQALQKIFNVEGMDKFDIADQASKYRSLANTAQIYHGTLASLMYLYRLANMLGRFDGPPANSNTLAELLPKHKETHEQHSQRLTNEVNKTKNFINQELDRSDNRISAQPKRIL